MYNSVQLTEILQVNLDLYLYCLRPSRAPHSPHSLLKMSCITLAHFTSLQSSFTELLHTQLHINKYIE